jgi:hypothetical protein
MQSKSAIEGLWEIPDFDQIDFELKAETMFESLKDPSYRAGISTDIPLELRPKCRANRQVGREVEKEIRLHGRKKVPCLGCCFLSWRS